MSPGVVRWIGLACLIASAALGAPQEKSSRVAPDAPSTEEKPAIDATKPQSLDELLLFFPAKHPAGNWNPTGLNFQDVAFESKDKTKLHAWYCPCEKPRGIVLMAHGNAGNVATRAGWLMYLQTRLRVSTFMFDYRGYGKSEGVPTVEGVLDDARAVMTKLCELTQSKDSDIIVMGESLGGAVAVQLAAERAPRALILQSTFSSLHDVADVHYPRLSWLVPADKLNSAKEITKYKGPLLLSHGTADGTIPFGLGAKLFKAANSPKSLVAIPDADHNDWLSMEYLRKLSAFLETLPAAK
jgi:fermentation-respiration switch protein FrsA (DUF1100 family)